MRILLGVLGLVCIGAGLFTFLMIWRAKRKNVWANPIVRRIVVPRAAVYELQGLLFLSAALWRLTWAVFAGAALMIARGVYESAYSRRINRAEARSINPD